MPPTFDLPEILDYFEENAGKILIVIGITSFTLGLLFLSSLPSMISIFGFFFGIIFTFAGILVHTETIVHNVSRADKVGAILIVISVVFFAGSFACFLVRDIGRVVVVVPFGFKLRSGENPRIFEVRIAEFSYPFLWLVRPLFLAALGSLIMGIILKH